MPISPEFALAPTMHYCQRTERKTMEETTEKRSTWACATLRAPVRLCVCCYSLCPKISFVQSPPLEQRARTDGMDGRTDG